MLQPHNGSSETRRDDIRRFRDLLTSTHMGSSETKYPMTTTSTITMLQLHKGSSETAEVDLSPVQAFGLQHHKDSSETVPVRRGADASARFNTTRVRLKPILPSCTADVEHASTPQRFV